LSKKIELVFEFFESEFDSKLLLDSSVIVGDAIGFGVGGIEFRVVKYLAILTQLISP
jgi:hypothetical protein